MKNKAKLMALFKGVLLSLIFCSYVATCFAGIKNNQFKLRGCAVGTVTDETECIMAREASIKNPQSIATLAWSPDGKNVAVLERLLGISIWDIDKHELIMSLQKPKGDGGGGEVAYSPDGRYLFAGSRSVGVWDAKSGAHVRDLVGSGIDLTRHRNIRVTSISFSQDGKEVAVAYDTVGSIVIYLFEVDSGALIRRIESEGETNTGFLESKDGKYLFGTRFYYTGERQPNGLPVTFLNTHTEIDILNAASGKIVKTIKDVHVMAPMTFALSHDESLFATGSWTGNVESTRNMKTGEFRTTRNNDPIRIWDAKTGDLHKELATPTYMHSLDFSPNGNLLVSCVGTNSAATHDPIWLWNIVTGQLVQKIEFTSERNGPICKFSPDGSKLAAGSGLDLVIYSFKKVGK